MDLPAVDCKFPGNFKVTTINSVRKKIVIRISEHARTTQNAAQPRFWPVFWPVMRPVRGQGQGYSRVEVKGFWVGSTTRVV